MEFSNEERTIRFLVWMMDVSLLIMVGWIVGMIVDIIRQS